ncbi:GAF domain-containing protein [Terriglobus saanensis]|uniref:GAF domain-containing protein n=1 Tax=Terriglobus saanensis TaxID=870903 RepID=UPI00059F2865|nr:GAF domain-containing protein [Terriglobus saanensis]
METDLANLAGTGLEVVDLETDFEFTRRHLHARDAATQLAGMQRLAQAFVDRPETILQELVNTAVDLCGADSAGISIENKDDAANTTYSWVATAGKYARFVDATLPSYPSACSVCIQRGQPQLFRVHPQFFDLMGIEAEIVTDGILIPWQVEETHGTLWIMAHERTEAFDKNDCRLMEALANFAAMGVRQNRQQKILMRQASASAAAAMANQLAHRINNPLQSLTNLVYLAAEGDSQQDTKALAAEMSSDLNKLSALVKKLLALPIDALNRS